MADIGTAYFRVAPNMTGVQGKIASGLRGSGEQFAKNFGTEVSGKGAVIVGALAGIASAATQKALQIISSSVGDAIKRVDILNNFPKVMSNMGISFDDAEAASKKLVQGLQGLPTTLDAGTLSVQRLTTKTKDINKATDIFLALNNAILAGGAPMELQATATEQFSQAFAKGKPDMIEWRAILAAMPAQLDQLATALGKASTDELGASLRDGSITMDQFSEALIKLNKDGIKNLPSFADQAKNATAGIQTSIAVMQTAITRGLTKIMEAIGTTNIANAIKTIGVAFERVFNVVATVLSDSDVQIAIVIAAIGGLAFAFWALAPAVWAALSPILPFIAAFVGLVAVVKLVRANWDKIAPIVDRVKLAFQQFWEVTKPVRDFIANQLKSAFDSLVSIGKQIGESLKPVIDAFKQILANKQVQQVLKAIGIVLLAIVAAPVVAFFAGLVAALTVVSKVLGFVSKNFKIFKIAALVALAPIIAPIALLVAAFKVIPKVVSAVADAVKSAFTTIKSVYDSTLGPIFSFIIDVVKTILTVFIRVWAAIALVVVGTMFIIGGIIKSVMEAVWGVVSSIWNAIYGVISSVVGFITGVIKNAWNFYYGIISGVLGKIWEVISSIWNRVSGFVGGVLSTIGNIIGGAWNSIYGTISNAVSRIWSVVTGTFNSVVNFAAGIGGRILGALGNFGGLLYDKGRDLINGLINGAGSLLSKIGQFFLNKLPGWIQGPFKKALGISSPSKVFAGYGENIGEGLTQGIDGSKGMVQNAVGNMTDSALAGVTNPLLSPSSFGTGQGAPGAGGNNTNQTVTIETVVLGNESAAKEFFRQLNQDTMNVGMGLTPIQGAQ